VQQIGADALLQVHAQGIRHVLVDRRVNEWRVPQGKTIVWATANKRQVVVALSSADFELDLDGQLNEYQDRKALGKASACAEYAGLPDSRQKFALFGEFLSHLFLPFILAFVGCGLQRSNRPNHLTRPREHPQYNQFTSSGGATFIHLHRGYARR